MFHALLLDECRVILPSFEVESCSIHLFSRNSDNLWYRSNKNEFSWSIQVALNYCSFQYIFYTKFRAISVNILVFDAKFLPDCFDFSSKSFALDFSVLRDLNFSLIHKSQQLNANVHYWKSNETCSKNGVF